MLAEQAACMYGCVCVVQIQTTTLILIPTVLYGIVLMALNTPLFLNEIALNK